MSTSDIMTCVGTTAKPVPYSMWFVNHTYSKELFTQRA